MKLYTDGTDWYFAENLEQLPKLFEEHHGETYEQTTGEPFAWEGWTECAPGSPFTITAYNLSDFPDTRPAGWSFAVDEKRNPSDPRRMTATVSAWAAVSSPGFFASTEF